MYFEKPQAHSTTAEAKELEQQFRKSRLQIEMDKKGRTEGTHVKADQKPVVVHHNDRLKHWIRTFLFSSKVSEASRDRMATGLRIVKKIKIILDRKVCTSKVDCSHYLIIYRMDDTSINGGFQS
jgi:hypothetical protein